MAKSPIYILDIGPKKSVIDLKKFTMTIAILIITRQKYVY